MRDTWPHGSLLVTSPRGTSQERVSECRLRAADHTKGEWPCPPFRGHGLCGFLRVRDLACVYEIVLREGTPQDVLTYIDGALLVDSWNSLVLPRDLRTAWSDVVDAAQAPQ